MSPTNKAKSPAEALSELVDLRVEVARQDGRINALHECLGIARRGKTVDQVLDSIRGLVISELETGFDEIL